MPPQSIAESTARGASWLLSWRMFTRFLGLISTVVLARLLEPADFGLMALGMATWAAANALSALGVQQQLVREDAPDRDLFNTAFTMNAIRGLLLGVALLLGSASVASFFGDPQLRPIVLAIALVFVLDGFGNVGLVEYRRELNFQKEFQANAVPRTIASLTVIGLAFVFRDYWALVIGMLAGRIVALGYGYVLHPFRPRLTLCRWRELTSFSFWSWANGVVALLRNRSDSIIIARLLGATSVGIYAIGLEIASLPFSELIMPVGDVLFASFAAVRQAGKGYESAYSRAIGGIVLMVLPATVGIAFLAGPVTSLLFGQKWLVAVPLIRILSMTGTFAVATAVGRNLLSSAGFPRISFEVLAVGTAVRVPLIIALTYRFGLTGCAYAVLFGAVIDEVLFLVVTMRRFAIRQSAVFAQVWRPALASTAMAGALAMTEPFWEPAANVAIEQVRALALATPLGGAVFGLVLWLLWLAAGRPRGAEVELTRYGVSILGAVFRTTRRRLPLFGSALR